MVRVLGCDICGKPTEEIVAKIFYTVMAPGTGAKSAHTVYDLHADVGVCCAEKLKKGFRWRKRVSAREYHASRRKAAKS